MQYFKNGKKIHIKESQKGSFTRYCGGNVTSECIARGKASPDPRIRKKATFADNVRKWKHQWGGTINTQSNEEFIDWSNIYVNPDDLKPYNKFYFGLSDDKWYVGKKATDEDKYLNVVKTIYGQLQSSIKQAYPNYSQQQIDNLADYMTRHYIKENGWTITNKLVGGYGKATSVQQWVNGMKKMYPNAMNAKTYQEYVNGLKANIQGNKYNSVNPNYYDELFRQFGGDKVKVGRLLKQVRDIK